jgi:hypothetical protein
MNHKICLHFCVNDETFHCRSFWFHKKKKNLESHYSFSLLLNKEPLQDHAEIIAHHLSKNFFDEFVIEDENIEQFKAFSFLGIIDHLLLLEVENKNIDDTPTLWVLTYIKRIQSFKDSLEIVGSCELFKKEESN